MKTISKFLGADYGYLFIPYLPTGRTAYAPRASPKGTKLLKLRELPTYHYRKTKKGRLPIPVMIKVYTHVYTGKTYR